MAPRHDGPPWVARYQERTSRPIPIVVLTAEDAEPRGASRGGPHASRVNRSG